MLGGRSAGLQRSFGDFSTYLEAHRAEAHLADHAATAQRLSEG